MSKDDTTAVEVLTERIGHLIERLDRFETSASNRFVTKDQFTPVQRIVYGGVGVILTSVLLAALALIVIRPH